MSSRIVKPFFGLKHLSEANSLPDATGQIVTHEITYSLLIHNEKFALSYFSPSFILLLFRNAESIGNEADCIRETQQICMRRKGGKKINISSRILYTNFSLSANQTDWSLKCLTLNVLLKPLGESKGDELHKGYILAW